MGRALGRGWLVEVTARVEFWRRRRLRAEADRLRAQYGEDAVRILRDQIAEAHRYKNRRRLYQLHDEVARGLG